MQREVSWSLFWGTVLGSLLTCAHLILTASLLGDLCPIFKHRN